MGKIVALLHSWYPHIDSPRLTRMPETMEITAAAKSGDGSVENVGIKMSGSFQCPECRQKFDTEKAKQLHWKFIHDPNRHQEDWAHHHPSKHVATVMFTRV